MPSCGNRRRRRRRRRLPPPNQPLPLPRFGRQQAGAAAKAKECYERAATGQERQRSGWHAAKNLEKAAELAGQLGQVRAGAAQGAGS